MGEPVGQQSQTRVRFLVTGMTCPACARRVETALLAQPGVQSAAVELHGGQAEVIGDPALAPFAKLREAVLAAGYGLELADGSTPHVGRGLLRPPHPALLGTLASIGLIALYLGLISLAQGFEHALQQFGVDRFFVVVIALGFGFQVGLYARLRRQECRASVGGVAASTGTSGAAMLACCAHHLVDVLPIVGLSGAAVFLNAYKLPLLWLGVAMNLAGVAYLLVKLARSGAAKKARGVQTQPGSA